jgi:hypothetical protein
MWHTAPFRRLHYFARNLVASGRELVWGASDANDPLRHHVETFETLPMGGVKVACTIAGVASTGTI